MDFLLQSIIFFLNHNWNCKKNVNFVYYNFYIMKEINLNRLNVVLMDK